MSKSLTTLCLLIAALGLTDVAPAATQAHAMFVGLHGDSNVISDVTFDDIDVLNLDEDDPEYQGAMAISAGDSNVIRDVTFRNIRVDHIEEGKLFNVRVVYNDKYGLSPGKSVENIK